MVVQQTVNLWVVGSSPTGAVDKQDKVWYNDINIRGVRSMVKDRSLINYRRGFDSLTPYFALITQLVRVAVF